MLLSDKSSCRFQKCCLCITRSCGHTAPHRREKEDKNSGEKLTFFIISLIPIFFLFFFLRVWCVWCGVRGVVHFSLPTSLETTTAFIRQSTNGKWKMEMEKWKKMEKWKNGKNGKIEPPSSSSLLLKDGVDDVKLRSLRYLRY